MTHVTGESAFEEKMREITPVLEKYSDYDLLIGIPFFNEKDILAAVLRSIDDVLQSWIGRRQLIVCAGDCSGQETLDIIDDLALKHPHIEFLMPKRASGRGMSIRSFLEIARYLEADLLIFNANMATESGPGIDLNCLEGLLTPIQEHYDMVLGSMRRHQGIDSIAHMLASPVLESFYGCRMTDPLGGIYAISHDFIEELVSEAKFWNESIAGFGIDFWLISRALVWNKSFCELNMGGIIQKRDLEKRNRVFYEMALAIFEGIRRDSAVWLCDHLIIKVPDILARSQVKKPDIIAYSLDQTLESFRKGYWEYKNIFAKALPEETAAAIKKLSLLENHGFKLDNKLWVDSILSLLVYYAFGDEESQGEILAPLTVLYNGRIGSYIQEMEKIKQKIAALELNSQNEILVKQMEAIQEELTEEFWRQKKQFNELWVKKSEQVKPPLVPLGYMEYVPGKPVVVPKRISGKDRRIVETDSVYRTLRKRYEDKFNRFLSEGLGIAADARPEEIVNAVDNFMIEVEKTLEKILPGDLNSQEGLKSFVDKLFDLIPHKKIFTISADLFRELLIRFPPVNLMVPLGYYKPAQLIENMDTRDAVSYANLVESWSYTDRDLSWLLDHLKPESFEWVDIKAIILDEDTRYASLPHTKISNLNRITARLAVKPLTSGKGGKFPRLRYFCSIVRRLSVAEHYSDLFQLNVSERKNISLKAHNALLGIQKGEDFSAHNIFENYHHRLMVEKIRQLAINLRQNQENDAASVFQLMADGYGLSQVLENGTFLSCTTWSWASYSFKGGLNIPTPMTTSVEGRWFNHDFLEALYTELGYNLKEIMQTVFRLIHAGKGGQNLLDTVLPARPRDVAVVIQETTNEPSKYLQRFEGNPILEPISEHQWECKYVLNPGALRIDDKVYLFYRAVGDDDVSHIGLAITDGYKVIERRDEAIFSPLTEEEKMGCEDPRLIIINEEIWMLYTAYDGNIAQIAAATISVENFLARKFECWQRRGLAFKNIWDKDAILFPEKINGKYILYHRIEPSMWITYMNEIAFPCRQKHAIIIGPRPGRMWDSLKIGAGAQPLKTRYGWLLIYHGVDYNYVYRLGVILVDANNPQKVLYRSPNPILEPVEDFEIGLSGAWVPNVVFSCGAVASSDKEILEDDDEILVYYGAADTSIGMAKGTLADLIPEKFRQDVEYK